MPAPAPRLRIGFLLARRFTLSAFANFVDILRLAADEGDRSRPILCGWRVLSVSMEPVTSSCGIAVQPDERPGDPARFDYIVVVGGLMEELERLDPDYVRYLHRAAEAGVPLVGVCTGAFILHRAGLMAGYRCCVSWFHHDDFLEQFDGLQPVSDQIFVVDRDRLTCSGGVSSAHLAAWLVDRHVGRAAAAKSLSIMIIDEALTGERPQPGLPLALTTRDPLVKRALLIMQQTLDTPISGAQRPLGHRDRQRHRLRRRVASYPGLPRRRRHHPGRMAAGTPRRYRMTPPAEVRNAATAPIAAQPAPPRGPGTTRSAAQAPPQTTKNDITSGSPNFQ